MHELSCNDTDSPACFLPSLASTNPQPDDIVDSLVEALRQMVAHPDTAFQTLAVEALDRVHAVQEAARRKLAAEGRGLTAARLALIIQSVEIQFRFERGTLLGRRRTQRIAMARQLAMFLCRSLTSASYPNIAEAFGWDHSTTEAAP